MKPSREFKLITQKFNIPHKFSSYSWEIRESVVLREFQEFGTFVYGEVAPTPGFPDNPLFLKRSKRLVIGNLFRNYLKKVVCFLH